MNETAARQNYLPFSRPSITEDDIEAVTQVLRSGWITTGSKAAEFEQAFCDYVESDGAVSVSSATAGMHVVFKALGIGPGDEVITPSMTWVSTVNLIALVGATPVFVDVDRDTLMVRPEAVRDLITPRTRCIVPVHFAGSAVDTKPLRALTADSPIHLVEDAAHAMGTRAQDEPVGSQGTVIFSFHPTKNLTTGEGGMVCSNDEMLLDQVRRLRFHGLAVDAYDRHIQTRSAQAQVVEPGYKYNMTDMAAALGLQQLSRLDQLNRKRAELALLYRELLEPIEEIRPLAEVPHCTRHAWHLFVVRLDIKKAGLSRDTFTERLKALNVGTGLHFRAVHLHKYYTERLGCKRGLLPHTEWNSDRVCSLPLFPDMATEDVSFVVDAIKTVLAEKR
jgi:UDP-4-amino-4-deoxy-L-arabinose-oxoglutarate aminotransferase